MLLWLERMDLLIYSEADVLVSQRLDAYFVSKAIRRLPYTKPSI
jgi:hypothetical protein